MDEHNDDYDILPHKELFDLKKQVEEMKGGPSPKRLMETMEDLKHTIGELIELFKTTSQELHIEEKEEATVHKKLDKLATQQKIIAEAILSLSEKISDHGEETPRENTAEPSLSPQPASQFAQQYPSIQSPSAPPTPPEPFTPRPFSLGQDPMQRPQPFSIQSPPPFPPQQGFGPPDFGAMGGSPYVNPPPSFGQIGTQPSAPPSDFPDFDDILGEKKKKKGLFGVFKK